MLLIRIFDSKIEKKKTSLSGQVETDELGLVLAVHLRPGTDAGHVQLKMLTTAFQVLQRICVWPLDKSRLGFSASRIDLTSFSDNEKQR